MYADWITNDEGVAECYGGTVGVPIFDGMSIRFVWADQGYLWFPAERAQ
jgi:hypothetical protein